MSGFMCPSCNRAVLEFVSESEEGTLTFFCQPCSIQVFVDEPSSALRFAVSLSLNPDMSPWWVCKTEIRDYCMVPSENAPLDVVYGPCSFVEAAQYLKDMQS